MIIDLNDLSVDEQLNFEGRFEFFAKHLEAVLQSDNCYHFQDLQNLSNGEYFRLLDLLEKFNLAIEDA